MSILTSSISELLELAKNSSDIDILDHLKKHVSSVIRREVARNKYTPKDILNVLAFDPVLNVSFIATQHQNCNIDRDFIDTNHPCISCKANTSSIRCDGCKDMQNFRVA